MADSQMHKSVDPGRSSRVAEPQLREALLADAENMAAIEHADGWHGRWTSVSFVQELRTAWSHAWVLEAPDATLAGFMVVWRVADEVHLLNIAVDGGWRRRGLGRAMLVALRGWAQTQGSAKILLELRRNNTAALRLYEGCGFIVSGERANYYADTGEDALLMECLL